MDLTLAIIVVLGVGILTYFLHKKYKKEETTQETNENFTRFQESDDSERSFEVDKEIK